jgi:ribosomal protein S16
MKASSVLGTKSLVPHGKKFLLLHSCYHMRLEVLRRHKTPIFQIVITNERNRIVACLGYYNPFNAFFKSRYSYLVFDSLKGNTIGLDLVATSHWLTKDITVSPSLVVILESLGLLKITSKRSTGPLLRTFRNLRTHTYNSLDILEKMKKKI